MGGWLPRFVDIFLWRFFGSSIHVSSLLMDGFPEEANRATRIEEIAIVVFPVQIWLNNICIWNFCLKVVFFTGQTEKKNCSICFYKLNFLPKIFLRTFWYILKWCKVKWQILGPIISNLVTKFIIKWLKPVKSVKVLHITTKK